MKLEAILRDPSAVYKHPEDVLNDSALSDSEKSQVLAQWEYDAREMQIATEENMPGPKETPLDDILAARKQLEG